MKERRLKSIKRNLVKKKLRSNLKNSLVTGNALRKRPIHKNRLFAKPVSKTRFSKTHTISKQFLLCDLASTFGKPACVTQLLLRERGESPLTLFLPEPVVLLLPKPQYPNQKADRLNKKNKEIELNQKSYSYIYTFVCHLIFILFFLVLSNLSVISLSNVKYSDISLSNINLTNSQIITKLYETPKHIVIPDQNIAIDISKAKNTGNSWIISEENASFIDTNTHLGEKRNNTIIFAHAKKDLFASLNFVNGTDSIYLLGDNKLYEYRVNKIETVDPIEVDKIYTLGESNLVLVTCQGENDEYRLIVKADLVSNYSIVNKEVI